MMQDGKDGDQEPGYIANIKASTTIGFKYFDMKNVHGMRITTRGYGDGTFEIKTAWDGPVLGTVKIEYTNVWENYETKVEIPDGVQALYLTYTGGGTTSLSSIEFL